MSNVQLHIMCMFCNIPIWSPDEGVGRTGNGGRSKICQLYLPRLRQQDVSCLDISVKHTYEEMISAAHRTPEGLQAQHAPKQSKHSPVNHVVGVKVSQPLKSTMGNCSYFNFLQRFLVNWEGNSHQQRCKSRKM